MAMVIRYETEMDIIAEKSHIEYPVCCFSQLGDFPSFFPLQNDYLAVLKFLKKLAGFLGEIFEQQKFCGGFGGYF